MRSEADRDLGHPQCRALPLKEALMNTTFSFTRHAEWEDWLTMGLGVLIAASPSIAGEPYTTAITLNAGLIGVAIFGIAAIELSELAPWEEWLNLAGGSWIMASPWMLGYSDHTTLMFLQLGLGAVVAVMALLELWQDSTGPAKTR